LIRCGKCGEKLQGKSAYSRIKKKHYYYSHKHTCKNDGINRIDAESTHKLILDWLRDISVNGEKFHQLQEQGKIRINNRIDFLNKSLKELDAEEIRLEKEIEARVSELVKTKLDVVKSTIEQSIVKLDEDKKDIEAKRLYIEYEIEELKKLLADGKNLFKEYSQKIKDILNKGFADIKEKLKDIVSYIRLDEKEIKIALSGVNQKGLVSALFASSPPDRTRTCDMMINSHPLYLKYDLSLPTHLDSIGIFEPFIQQAYFTLLQIAYRVWQAHDIAV